MSYRVLCLALVSLSACGGLPEVEGEGEQQISEVTDAGYMGQQVDNTVPTPGTWADLTQCNGTEINGHYASDWGFNPPRKLGTTPVGCRPEPDVYSAACHYGGNGFLPCIVSVNAAGDVFLVSPEPIYYMSVWPTF